MLKIRDDVDLEELRKYGFVKRNSILRPREYVYMTLDGYDNIPTYVIYETDRLIGSQEYYLSNTIYDLIQAGLVEKVEKEV